MLTHFPGNLYENKGWSNTVLTKGIQRKKERLHLEGFLEEESQRQLKKMDRIQVMLCLTLLSIFQRGSQLAHTVMSIRLEEVKSEMKDKTSQQMPLK